MGAASSREGDAAREHTRRCRERRRLMREAARLRHHLAASHAAYLRSLGVVASALTRFAVGEPLPVSDHTPPAVLAHRPVVAPSTPPPLLRAIDQPQREEARGGASAGVGVGSGSAGAAAGEDMMRMVVRHRSLAEVAAGLEEYFLKASVAGDTVSSLLEASSTAEFNGGSHSFLGALCCLSAPALDRVDSMGSRQRHSATLQQLLAWEKKLYKDVKAREKLQIRHDKKLAALRDQEYSRKVDVDIQKLKAAWDRARAQLEAASQSADAASASIAQLRDTRLARQLLELCHATLDMWRAMRQHHGAQSLFAQQLRGLSSRTSMDPTTEIHHQATRALEAAMAAWAAAMAHMAKHQRDYVHAIHGWLKLTLTLTPVDAAEASPLAAELTAFVERWGKVLDRVNCVDVLKAIKSFAGAAARSTRSRATSCGWRGASGSTPVETSYYDSYLPGVMSMWHWGRPAWRDHLQARDAGNEVAQRRDEIAACRKMVEDEMRRHAKAIDATRTATITGVQGKLPAVFQSMAAFSASLANSLEDACKAPQQNTNDMQS
ncbi:hypothetical protein ZEAMMB73_Zm00001d051338 [Zea mays]|uniref:Uncharacterized protein n=1 Tax=Zea mays TaxID=4577 RepID=K7UHN0_MAIZE|nr:hypothetical protein ZEAMMB73_Zm00001d051338 [Zea mays]